MATSVGLNFRLTAAVDKFEASMRDVEKRLGGIEKASKDTASGMRVLAAIEVGKSVLNGITGLFNIFKSGVSSVVSFANEARAAADAIGKLASSTGMAHEPLQVFQKLAEENGISGDKLGEAVKRMTKRLAEAKMGFGEALPALERLGLNVEELASMRPEQAFLKIGAAIGQLPQKGDQAAAAFKIFSDQGLAMVPMFANLEANVKDTADEMLSLGQILSGTQIQNIEAMNDAFADVKRTAFQIGTQVLANFAPMITDANKALIEFVKNFQFDGEIGGQALANFLTEAFFDGAEILAKWGDDFLNALSALVDKFADAFEYVFGDQKIETPAIKKWNDEIDEYAEQIRQSLLRARKGLESQDEHERRVGALRAAIAEKQKLIAEEEARVLTKKREYNTGLGSMQDSLAKARQLYDEKAKEAQQRQDKINAAFDKTIENAEKTAANPALDALAEEFAKLGKGAATATDPIELFGKANGVAGKELEQLAIDAEKFGPNADLAREALDGMAGAADDATPAAELFGRNVGLSGDALERLALAAEAAQEIDSIEDALSPLRDAGALTGQELETLAALVAQSGGKYGELGSALQDLIRTGKNLDRVQQSLTDSMMKPAEDFANQRAEMLRRMGFNPFFVEDQKQKWLAQQKAAVDRQVEIQREAYEKFKEKIGEGLGDSIKDALETELDIESTLPELKTQSATLSSILTAIENKLQGAATFAIEG